MPFCVSCGTKLSDDALFCFACGAKVAQAAAPVEEEPVYIPPVEEPVYRELAYEIPASQRPAWEAPAHEEPAYEAPAYEAPAHEEPAYEAPAYEASAYEAPAYEEPAAYEAPAYQQPEMTVPPVEAVPEKPRKEKLFKKKPIALGRRILVIFLCVLTFIFGTASLAAYCIQDVISAEVITAMMDQIDLSEIEARDLITNASRGESISEWIYGQIKARVPKMGKMTEENVQDYLEQFVYPFAKQEAAEFIEVLLTGKGEAAITADEVRQVIVDSSDYLEEEFDIILTNQDIDKLVNWLVDSELEEKANTEYLEDEFSDELELVRLLDGSIVFIIFAVLTLILLVLVIVNNKSLIRNLNSVGIVSLSVGGVFGFAALADLVAPKLMLELCGENELVANLAGSVVERLYLPVIVLAGVGIVLLVISNALQAIKVKSK